MYYFLDRLFSLQNPFEMPNDNRKQECYICGADLAFYHLAKNLIHSHDFYINIYLYRFVLSFESEIILIETLVA